MFRSVSSRELLKSACYSVGRQGMLKRQQLLKRQPPCNTLHAQLLGDEGVQLQYLLGGLF